MHYLLDTHILLWWLNDDKKLSKKARDCIINADKIYISSASIWEINIKRNLGKLEADIDCLIASSQNQGFIELPIMIRHIEGLNKLDSHHRDPFDRIMIAQAIMEPLRFLTSDQTLEKYSDLIDVV